MASAAVPAPVGLILPAASFFLSPNPLGNVARADVRVLGRAACPPGSQEDSPVTAALAHVVDLICPARRAPVGEQAPDRPRGHLLLLKVGAPGGQPPFLEHGDRRPSLAAPGRCSSRVARRTRSGHIPARYASPGGQSSSPPTAPAVRRVLTGGEGTHRRPGTPTTPGLARASPRGSRSLPFPSLPAWGLRGASPPMAGRMRR